MKELIKIQAKSLIGSAKFKSYRQQSNLPVNPAISKLVSVWSSLPQSIAPVTQLWSIMVKGLTKDRL